MIQLPCPYCGLRNSAEFAYQGESRSRPPAGSDPATWRSYLYLRHNPAGWTTESWYHRSGCRRFLVVERHTVTNEVRAARLAGTAGSGSDVEGGTESSS
ncbi:MAG TPA: sarcosine oxidase subunit delta [Acidimicrobiales bacterium]|nr:sarcosine oxidase subunit delta [Acidimicrobiales bacterium]